MSELKEKDFVVEPERTIPVVCRADVIVCGGGPAGVCAAVAAARQGAKTVLLERGGALGGIMTSGLMSNIIDSEGRHGLIREIIDDLIRMGAKGDRLVFDVEITKYYLEQLCRKAGVEIRLHTGVTAGICDSEAQLRTVITESKSGREAWQAKVFIDATGDGDLAARSGCRWESGRPENGFRQAMSFCALLYGVKANSIQELLRIENDDGKRNLRELLTRHGCTPSYGQPTLFRLGPESYLLMSNHQYGASPLDAAEVTQATLDARQELYQQLQCLKQNDPRFTDARFGATADYIGIREARRIRGLYQVTCEDLIAGRRHADAVCRMRFDVDVHATSRELHTGYSTEGCHVKPYDIPLRALIAADVKGLMMAGRCISGDFYAHASYRVIGGAMPMGEAAGKCAALAARLNCLPQEVPYANMKYEI